MTQLLSLSQAFKPSFKKYPMQSNQFATRYGNTTLICRPEAAPYPTKKWYKNGMVIDPPTTEGARVRLLPNGNIFISPVQDSDQAVYKCAAQNDYGQEETAGNLTVLGEDLSTCQGSYQVFSVCRSFRWLLAANMQCKSTFIQKSCQG